MKFDEFINEDCNRLADELKAQGLSVSEQFISGQKTFLVRRGGLGTIEYPLNCEQIRELKAEQILTWNEIEECIGQLTEDKIARWGEELIQEIGLKCRIAAIDHVACKAGEWSICFSDDDGMFQVDIPVSFGNVRKDAKRIILESGAFDR